MTTKRHYMNIQQDGSIVFDPRYLVFEYVFGIMLRKSQVVMVNDFARKAIEGGSMVQQMIMGAGKTTVIGKNIKRIEMKTFK